MTAHSPMKGCALQAFLWLAGLVAMIGAAFAALRSAPEAPGNLPVVAIFTGLLGWIAAAVLISAVKAWRERARLIGGIAGEMPVDGPAMIVGHIESQGRLLEAPLSGRPCVAYTYEVYTMRSGTRHRTKMVCLDGIGLMPSQIVTRTGSFRLQAVPEFDCDNETLDLDLAVQRANARVRTLPLMPPKQPGTRPAIEAQWNDDDGEFLRDSKHIDEEVGVPTHWFVERRIEPGARVCVVGQFSSTRRAIVPDPNDWSKTTRIMKGDPDAIARRLGRSVATRTIVGLLCAALAIAVVAIHFLPRAAS